MHQLLLLLEQRGALWAIAVEGQVHLAPLLWCEAHLVGDLDPQVVGDGLVLHRLEVQAAAQAGLSQRPRHNSTRLSVDSWLLFCRAVERGHTLTHALAAANSDEM